MRKYFKGVTGEHDWNDQSLREDTSSTFEVQDRKDQVGPLSMAKCAVVLSGMTKNK